MSSGHNFIAFACGMKRSGKSRLLAELARKFPRRLIFDFIEEYVTLPGAIIGRTLGQTADALRKASARPQWTVVSTLYERDVPELLARIIPSGGSTVPGFSRAVGGMVVECGEIDLIAPNNGSIPQEVRDMFQRGRHHGLSVLAATQRPRDTHRVVTSQSNLVAAFRQHEPRDVEYLNSVMSGRAGELLPTLARFEHLRYFPNEGELHRVTASGAVTVL